MPGIPLHEFEWAGTDVFGYPFGIAGNIFESLYTLNEDYKPVSMLAESLDVSEDGKTYTFQLREGIKFHNGKEMNTNEGLLADVKMRQAINTH